ncbi:MAG: NmrA family NAD(P)-binding protein [Bacteroidota bacterium]
MSILFTGATGLVGQASLRAINALSLPLSIRIASHRPAAERTLPPNQEVVPFDFWEPVTFLPALNGVETLFLLRPPHIADVPQVFEPLIAAAVQAQVQHIVFLSVQGVEKMSFIPHHKIERLIESSGLRFTFLRPAYFMQNFLTTLHPELVENQRIFLPAGKAKFALIDVRDIGAAVANILASPAQFAGKKLTLTNEEVRTFGEMAAILQAELGVPIKDVAPGLFRFIGYQRKKGVAWSFILVMLLLHFLPRFQADPTPSSTLAHLLERPPVGFQQFVRDHREQLLGIDP